MSKILFCPYCGRRAETGITHLSCDECGVNFKVISSKKLKIKFTDIYEWYDHKIPQRKIKLIYK